MPCNCGKKSSLPRHTARSLADLGCGSGLGIKLGVERWKVAPHNCTGYDLEHKHLGPAQFVQFDVTDKDFPWQRRHFYVCFNLLQLLQSDVAARIAHQMAQHAVSGVQIRIPTANADLLPILQEALMEGLGERSASVVVDGNEKWMELIAEIGD
jgi:trans-aconitate methyltransferase